MQAYEFYAKLENGMIPIPEQYKNLITDQVMVIVLVKEPWRFNREEAKARKKTDLLSPPDLKTKANER